MRTGYLIAVGLCLCATVSRADSVYDLQSTPQPTRSQVFAAFSEVLQAREASPAVQTDAVSTPLAVVDISNGPIPGDANLDNRVNFADLIILAQNYGSQTASWQTGDFNNDHKVGFPDLIVLAQNYGDVGIAASVVPTPSSTWGGLALMATLVGWWKLRRKSNACC